MEKYLQFNSAVNQVFFNGRFQARPVYLDLEDITRDEVSERLSLDSEDFDNELGLVVSNTLCWHDTNIYSWHLNNLKKWQSAKFEENPPIAALLLTFSLAAEHMRQGEDFSSTNYYQRLCEVYGIKDESKKAKIRSRGKDTLIFWKALNHWLTKNDYQFGKPTARQVSNFKYVSYSLSQSLVRDADRKNLHKMFEHFGLSSHENLNESDIAQYLHEWMTTSAPSNWLKKLWGNPDLRERIITAAASELEDWDESLQNSNNDKNHINLRLNWSIVTQSFPKSQLTLYLVTSINENYEDTELRFANEDSTKVVKQAFNNAEKVWLTEYAGTKFAYLDSTSNINLNALLLASFELESTDKRKKYRCEPRAIIPLIKLEGSQLFREVKKISLFSKHNILCHITRKSVVETLLQKYARSGYSVKEHKQLDGLPNEWVLFKNVEITSIPEEASNELQDLVPLSEGLNMHAQGGLKLASGIWHALAPPEIFVSDDQGILDVVIKNNELFFDDGRDVYTQSPSTYNPDFLKQQVLSLDSKNLILVASKNGKTVFETDISFRSASTPRKLIFSKGEILFYPSNNKLKLNLFGATSFNESQVYPFYLQGMCLTGKLPDQQELFYFDQSQYREAKFGELGNWKDYDLGPLPDESASCIVRGYHVWDCEYQSRNMTCKDCGLHTISRKKSVMKKSTSELKNLSQKLTTGFPAKNLETSEEVKISSDIVFDSICYLGAGSWRQLQSILSETVEVPWQVIVANQNLIDLGLLDQAVQDNGYRPTHWSCPPPVLVITKNAMAYLAGFRNKELIEAVKKALDVFDFTYECIPTNSNLAPSSHFWNMKSYDLYKVEKALSQVSDFHGRELLVKLSPENSIITSLPSVSEIINTLPTIHIENEAELEKFDLKTGKWTKSKFNGMGAYRTVFAGRRYFYHSHGVSKEASYELIKLLAAREAKLFFHKYNLDSQTFECNLGCTPPGLYKRALVSCSGKLPITKNGKTIYEGIPKEIAAAMMYKLYN